MIGEQSDTRDRRARHSGPRRDDRRDTRDQHQRPPPNILQSEKIVTDRKIFFLDLISNDRGQVIRITEDVNGRRDRIMLPAEALRDFITSLEALDSANPA